MAEGTSKRSGPQRKLRVVGGTEAPKALGVSVDQECVDCLADLAAAAKAGEVTGIAYAVMYKGRHFITSAAGELRRNPTFARGAVAALDDELKAMVWGES